MKLNQKLGEFLKARAERFLEIAKYSYKKGYEDICVFSIVQSTILFLKYEIWKLTGNIEETRKVGQLLDKYADISNNKEGINKLREEYMPVIRDLEIANIEIGKDLSAQFLKEQIDLMFKFLEDLLKIFSENKN
jgi:HEPN domain-containing protein